MKYDHTHIFYGYSYRVAEFFTSLAFVMFVLILFMGYRFYEVQTLFNDSLLRIPDTEARFTAATLIALVFIFITLGLMVHSERLMPDHPGSFRLLLALVGLFINLFFWEPWASTGSKAFFGYGISVVQCGIDWTLPYLFEIVWRKILEQTKTRDLLPSLEELKATLEAKRTELKKLDVNLTDRKARLDDLTCPHCKRTFQKQNGLNSHVGKCPENPTLKKVPENA